MIKGDVVYIYDDNKIKRTQVESVKDSVIDGNINNIRKGVYHEVF